MRKKPGRPRKSASEKATKDAGCNVTEEQYAWLDEASQADGHTVFAAWVKQLLFKRAKEVLGRDWRRLPHPRNHRGLGGEDRD